MNNGTAPNEIKPIPISDISPFRGQPRGYFEPAALQELAESIRHHGQMTPAWVSPLPSGRYQLIAGERRWRACKLAGLGTLICEVRKGLSRDEQYLASVMENFGRKDCTPMETARSVGYIFKMNRSDLAKTAAVFARSEQWVRLYLRLLRLAPEVAAMLEPPDPRLDFRAGLSLSNVQPEQQLSLAKQIAALGLRKRAATRFVRTAVCKADLVEKRGGGRQHRPSDDYETLQHFLGGQVQKVVAIDADRMRAAFADRSPRDLASIRTALRQRVKELLAVEIILASVSEESAGKNDGR